MHVVEVKNNLVKISYDTMTENLVLAGFLIIKDSAQSFIGQIIHLEANPQGSFAILQLLFTFDEEGVIKNYNGSVPNVKCVIEMVYSQELLELLPVENPVLLGEIAQQSTKLRLDRSLFEKKLLVCSEKEDDNNILIKNSAGQLFSDGQKVLVLDLNGNLKDDKDLSKNVISAGVNFKLPLNYESINFIYEKGLDDASPETKALVQEIFLEIQNYVKSISEKFIPFENFKNVVDAQYNETEMTELVLLKNKLLKYYENGVFAQKKEEFNSLKISLEKNEPTVFDLSAIEENVQREMISYVYSLINQLDKEVYVICNLDDANSDKKLLKQILTTKKAYSTLICSYSYKYLKELKKLSGDLILFAPIQQQNDFAIYNAFLSKLNVHEFIIYGQSTHYLPLIVKLEDLSTDNKNNVPQQQDLPAEVHETVHEESLLDKEIKKDVDEIFTVPKSDKIYQENESFAGEFAEDLTEDDLDFIDNLNIVKDEKINLDESEQKVQTEIQEEIHENFSAEKPFYQEAGENVLDISENSGQNYQQTEEKTPEYQDNILNELEQIEEPADILPAKMSSAPIIPVYSADIEPVAHSDELMHGDVVTHPKYGKGTVEKLITYGSKTLCSINFDNVGRRLLDPALVEIKKI